MNKMILTLIISIITLSTCNAQKIEIKKVFIGYKYTQNGNNLSLSELSNVVKTNAKSFELIKKAKIKMVFGSIIGGIGGVLIGFPIGTAIGGGEPNWTLAGIGVGCIAIGIPLGIGADKNINEAAENYNTSLNPTAFNNSRPEFKLKANGQGLGLEISF